MNFTDIINPNSGEVFNLFSREGKNLLKNFIRSYKKGGSFSSSESGSGSESASGSFSSSSSSGSGSFGSSSGSESFDSSRAGSGVMLDLDAKNYQMNLPSSGSDLNIQTSIRENLESAKPIDNKAASFVVV